MRSARLSLPGPRRIPRTGDDTPARSIWGYAMRMTGWHQAGACLLAVLVAFAELVPIELQRRLIDDAIVKQDAALLLTLGAVYVAVLLVHRVLKFLLGLYQSWLSESAAIYTRRHLLGLQRGRPGKDDGPGEDDVQSGGEAVAIIGHEIDQLAGFVGEGPSRAFANLALVLGAIGYMATIQPKIAALALLLLVPQIVLTLIMQNRLNRLTERRVALMREVGEGVAGGRSSDDRSTSRLVGLLFDNRMLFYAWKFLMKGMLNLLSGLAPLTVLVWGGWLAIQGQATVGILVAFVSGFERISGPIRELIAFYRNRAQAGVQHDMIARWMQR